MASYGGPLIGIIMTCHNRRDTTVGCLEALKAQDGHGLALELVVTDDGSTDGTSEAIAGIWPDATIVQGTGTLYWAAGMALAERAAVRTEPDYLLWLNDDTVLDNDAVPRLLAAAERHPGAIIVGATEDPDTGESTYGGRLRPGGHPQRLLRLPIADTDQRADTFNGNIVLIPSAVREHIGPIDGLFPHAYADDDYGLRATARGIAIIQAPGSVGRCGRKANSEALTAGPIQRWRRLQSPTHTPWQAQTRFLRRHGDWRWPVWLMAGQLKRMLKSAE